MVDEENVPEEEQTEASQPAAPDAEQSSDAESNESAQQEVTQGLEQVVEAADEVAEAVEAARPKTSRTIDFILDVTLAVTIEVGRARMTIQDLLQLGQGSVVELEKLAGEPLDVFINGKRVAIGEAVIVNEKFGVRLKEIISPEERLQGLM